MVVEGFTTSRGAFVNAPYISWICRGGSLRPPAVTVLSIYKTTDQPEMGQDFYNFSKNSIK